MTLRNALHCMIVLSFAAAVSPWASAQNWEYLGEANVDGGSDHDTIRVDDNKGLFRAIRFHVEKGAVDFDRVVAHFESGDDAIVPLHSAVPPGQYTRRLDLKGGSRKLKSVEVWYRRAGINQSQKPKIRLMGIRH